MKAKLLAGQTKGAKETDDKKHPIWQAEMVGVGHGLSAGWTWGTADVQQTHQEPQARKYDTDRRSAYTNSKKNL